MSANQRRSGFRLPWLSESDEPDEAPASPEAASTAAAGPSSTDAPAAAPEGQAGAPVDASSTAPAADPAATNGSTPPPAPAVAPAAPAGEAPGAVAAAPPSSEPAAKAEEPPSEFLRELIGAMRTVADEARNHGVQKLKADAEEAVRTLEADAERRRQELRERADADITGVGDWARAEAERIKAEAEQRVAARRAQLDQQLAAEGTRTEAETKALRARVDDYERELDAFHAQLTEINDPAAFAAAAKRMPAAPDLRPRSAEPSAGAPPAAAAEPTTGDATAAASEPAAPAASTSAGETEVHPAEEEVLATRLAELDEKLRSAPPSPAPGAASTATAAATADAQVTTDIVVKGLGSFGAITGFRQALSGQPGITAVALSLGQSGEFVFRATHAAGFDVAAVIRTMEGDNATVEDRTEGGLRVTLERAR